MNQAGSENTCFKTVSYESILNNYNFDEVSNNQNKVCKDWKQTGSWSVCGKRSPNVVSIRNTKHVVDVAKVCSRQAKGQQQQQAGTSHICQQSLLQNVWVHLQSIITAHMSGCPRCNAKCPTHPVGKSVSQSSVQSFLSSPASPPILSCKQSCLSCTTTCHTAPCLNARPSCQTNESPYFNAKSFCPKATSSFHKSRASFSSDLPSCPNITLPSSHFETISSIAESSNPKLISIGRNAKPSFPLVNCPITKPSCGNAECPSAKPSCLKAEYSYAKPLSLCEKTSCPNAKSVHRDVEWSHTKPFFENAECPDTKPACPHSEHLNTKSLCSTSIISRPNAQRLGSNAVPVCPISKTKLYHSFSNDSLSSICKEDLIEQMKAYLQKITSSHKINCPRCSKQTNFVSPIETITSYLRNLLEQAWSYLNTNSGNTYHAQCALPHSNTAKKSHCPTNSRCCCATSQLKCQKTQSLESLCFQNPGTCPKHLTPEIGTKSAATCPKAVKYPTCFKPATCLKPASCIKRFECEDTPSSGRKSVKQGTHEHKSCYTPCCKHNSQGVQRSFNVSDTSVWSSVNSNPRPHKTPQSVEELKASITGITSLGKHSGNLLGCEIMDFRSTIKYFKPCVEDTKLPKDTLHSIDKPTSYLGVSLTEEQKDHKYDLEDCKQSKESLNHCENALSPCIDTEEQKDEVGSHTNSGAHCGALMDEEISSMPTEQLRIKAPISTTGCKSITCVDTIQPDCKDCNSRKKDAYRKDPHNYRYYY